MAGAPRLKVRDAQPLGATAALVERGPGLRFAVRIWGLPATGFVVRVDGRLHAYANRCAHVPAELDGVPGHFFDARGEFLQCSLHGARYDAATGRCAGGACAGRGNLMAIRVDECDGKGRWYPSDAIQPAEGGEAPPLR